jgi:tetratricopeptide (TPR) repeat protein
MSLDTIKLADQYLSQAHSALAKGNFITAKAMVEAAIKLDPSFEAYNTLGVCFGSANDFKSAIACFDKSLEMKPDQTEAKVNRSTALIMQGKMARLYEIAEGRVSGIDKVITDMLDNLFKENSNNV